MQAIGKAEAGDYDKSFGDVFDKKLGYVTRIRDQSKPGKPFYDLMTPEQWSEKTLNKRKRLTEMNLGEVLEFQKYRNSKVPSSAAVGTYGFMVSGLFGENYKTNPNGGIVKEMGLSMDTPFNKDTQDKIAEYLLKKKTKSLNSFGVPTTPEYQYMSWYIGEGGAAAIWRAIQSGDGDKKVGDILTAAKIRWAPNVNPELGAEKFNQGGVKNTAKNFVMVMGDRLKKGGLQTHMEPNPGNIDVSGKSIDNADMKKSLSQRSGAQSVVVNNTTNVLNKETTVASSSDRGSDNPQYKRQ